jgi:Domain of unknown function (DUF5606)
MNFKQIVAISGLPGLFQLMATKSDGAIVRSIEDSTTRFVGARQHSVSSLDGIEVYTNTDNVRLFEVFLTMKENSTKVPALDLSKADNKGVQEHFGQLFPDYDRDRVYASDMKKMVKWFYILNGKDLLKSEEAITETSITEEKVEEKAAVKKEEKTPKAPKAEKVEVAKETSETEEKPAKKAAAKKPKAEATAEGKSEEGTKEEAEPKKKVAKAKKPKADEGDATDK